MKSKFSCFYDVKDEGELKDIWESSDTTFIFDTNVLLSLYSFKTESRKDFFMALSKIRQHIWIPFHVCLEFQLNRILVIKNRRNSFSKLKKEINGLKDVLKLEKKYFSTLQTEFSLQKKHPEIHQKIEKIQTDLTEGVKKLCDTLKISIHELNQDVDKIDTEKLFVNSDDFIRKEIDDFFSDEKVGENIFKTQDEIDKFNEEGEVRYSNGIPPGYEDAKDKGEGTFCFDGLHYKRKFGDLIIFKQIIEYAKERKLKNIIFLSEDIKEDWRQIEDFDGRKILGARIELKREIYKEANVSNFLIFNIEDFMKNTNKYLNVEFQRDTISSIKESLAKSAEDFKRLNKIKSELLMKNNMEKQSSLATDIDEVSLSNNNLNPEFNLHRDGVIIDESIGNSNFSYSIDKSIIFRSRSCISRLTKMIHSNISDMIKKEIAKYRRDVQIALNKYKLEGGQLYLNMLELKCNRAESYLVTIQSIL